MSFLIKDDEVWEKYKQIWGMIKNKLEIKFHSFHSLKTKVRESNGVIKTNFLNNWHTERKYALCLHCLHYY